MGITIAERFIRVRGETSSLRNDLSKGADSAGKKAGKKAGSGFSRAFRVGVVSIGATLGFTAITKAIGGFVEEGREAERMTRLTNAALKSTKGVAHVTAAGIGALANRLSQATGVDDELIQSSENLLLTFTRIRNETGKGNQIFDTATARIEDMAAAMNHGEVTASGLKSSSILVGKALNDPIKGLTALRRVGVAFTKQQTEQIKKMVESGNILGAQKIILGELKTEFGGTAAAAADPAQKAKVAWQNFQEFIGGLFLPTINKAAGAFTSKVIPGLKAMISAFREGDVTSDGFVGVMERVGVAARKVFGIVRDIVTRGIAFVQWLRDGSTGAEIFKTVLVGLVGAFLAYKTAVIVIAAVTKAWAIAQAALNLVMSLNPIGIVVLAVGALVGVLIYAYTHSQRFREVVQTAWTVLRTVVLAVWNNALKPALTALANAFRVLKPVLKIVAIAIGVAILPIVALGIALVLLWKRSQTFRNIVTGVFKAVRIAIQIAWFIINLTFMALRKLIEKVVAPVILWLWRNVVRPAFAGIWGTIRYAWNNVIKPVLSALAGFIKRYVAPGFRLGVDAIKQQWNRLKAIVKGPVNFLIKPVYMDGIRKVFNTAAKNLGVSQRLPVIHRFAAGGVLDGYSPGRDTIPALLSPGEGVLRPEVVKALGPDQIYAWNKAAKQRKRIQLFADGGIAGFFTNPVGWLKGKVTDKISGIVSRFGNNAFTKLVTALPRKILSELISWVKAKIAAGFGFGGGARFLGGPSGNSVATILALARRFQSNAQVSSGWRPGDPGYHGRGLAADLIGGGTTGMNRIAAGFYRISGRLLEEIHSPSWFVKNGRRVGPAFYGSEYWAHFNHVHIAAYRNALAPLLQTRVGPGFVADNGTVLQPGWNLRYNGTGRPETLGRGEPTDYRAMAQAFKREGLVLVYRDPDRSLGGRANRLSREPF